VRVALRVITAEDWFEQHSQQLGNTDHHLWGPHIRKEAVTLFVGETSVGKTTLLYNLCYKLSRGESFLDIAPPHPLRILHLDYEEDTDTRLTTMFHIGYRGKNWHFMARDEDGGDKSGPALFHDLDEIKPGKYDLIIVDPLCEAYPVKNENDNEEANVQMRLFRKLARSKQVAVMLVHNTGRPHYNHKTGEQSAAERATKKHMGRGATARADRADIGINYVAVDKTVRMLCVAKSRTPGHLGHQWVLDFDGNHGLKVRTVESHVSSHQNPPSGEIEIETSALTTILNEHAGEGLQSIYDMYIKGTFPLSRATFYRRVQAIRTQPGSGATSPISP
jgi:GTPase SAR1 family protein